MKLGSLFDGSGGFPLAGSLCGIIPKWASEVEPYPIAVTTSRFPYMKHLGDVSKVNGADIEPVDIITFGSPCQDLSVAGKRAGLKHEANGDDETTRSGLFMEAVRIIKEMRKATNGLYPTFALWENVPGAFSSNGGDDFRVVLEELIKIVEPSASVPAVGKNGWPYSDAYVGDRWSLAYRTFDAQYWGVPQRRRRIYLVTDFRGERAAEILFEREGLRGYFEKGRTPWQGIAADAQSGAGADDRERDKSGIIAVATQQGGAEIFQNGKCPTITAAAGMSGNNQPWVCFPKTENTLAAKHYGSPQPDKGNGANIVAYNTIPIHDMATRFSGKRGDKTDGKGNGLGIGNPGDPMNTLTAGDRHAVTYAMQGFGDYKESDQASGLKARDYKDATDLICQTAGVDCRNLTESPELYPTLQAKPNGGQSLNYSGAVRTRYIVRRLTPTECARLQGFPDTWGHPDHKETLTDDEYRFWLDVRNTHAAINGKQTKDYTHDQILTWYNNLHTDSSEYKMWGNGIALPTALYVMQGIADKLREQEE